MVARIDTDGERKVAKLRKKVAQIALINRCTRCKPSLATCRVCARTERKSRGHEQRRVHLARKNARSTVSHYLVNEIVRCPANQPEQQVPHIFSPRRALVLPRWVTEHNLRRASVVAHGDDHSTD